jgi:RNA polymerase sigma-70 factor (ECF subfamily)
MPDWQEILARDGRAAWQTAYRLLGNQADADDCFQEACLAAVHVARRETVQNWRALLQRLATMRAMDQLRARVRGRRKQGSPRSDEPSDPAPAPFQTAEEAELAQELRLALSKIPPRQAEVFCLHCVEDWSYDEIARHARLSVTAVGVHLHRARKRLRALLARFRDQAPASARAVACGESSAEMAHERKEHS